MIQIKIDRGASFKFVAEEFWLLREEVCHSGDNFALGFHNKNNWWKNTRTNICVTKFQKFP